MERNGRKRKETEGNGRKQMGKSDESKRTGGAVDFSNLPPVSIDGVSCNGDAVRFARLAVDGNGQPGDE